MLAAVQRVTSEFVPKRHLGYKFICVDPSEVEFIFGFKLTMLENSRIL